MLLHLWCVFLIDKIWPFSKIKDWQKLLFLDLEILVDSAQPVGTPSFTWPQIQSSCRTFPDGLSLRLADNKIVWVWPKFKLELRLSRYCLSHKFQKQTPSPNFSGPLPRHHTFRTLKLNFCLKSFFRPKHTIRFRTLTPPPHHRTPPI